MALVASCVLAGCPPPPVVDIPDAGVEDQFSADDYCESIVDFFCPFYVRCGRMAVADEDACAPVFLEACNARFEPSYVSLEEAGLLSLSQEGIDGCRAHLDTVACEDQLLDLDGPCADMWIGTQAVGEACGFDIETFVCEPGALCTLDLTLCGACERVVADGEDCTLDGVTCARESFCDGDVCVARKRVGEPCEPDDRCLLGAVCADGVCVGPTYVGLDDACSFEARCPYASQCIDGACHATVALGDACDPFAPCDSGFCGADDVCVALIAQGGACSDNDECQTGVCGTDGVCDALPSLCLQ